MGAQRDCALSLPYRGCPCRQGQRGEVALQGSFRSTAESYRSAVCRPRTHGCLRLAGNLGGTCVAPLVAAVAGRSRKGSTGNWWPPFDTKNVLVPINTTVFGNLKIVQKLL